MDAGKRRKRKATKVRSPARNFLLLPESPRAANPPHGKRNLVRPRLCATLRIKRRRAGAVYVPETREFAQLFAKRGGLFQVHRPHQRPHCCQTALLLFRILPSQDRGWLDEPVYALRSHGRSRSCTSEASFSPPPSYFDSPLLFYGRHVYCSHIPPPFCTRGLCFNAPFSF